MSVYSLVFSKLSYEQCYILCGVWVYILFLANIFCIYLSHFIDVPYHTCALTHLLVGGYLDCLYFLAVRIHWKHSNIDCVDTEIYVLFEEIHGRGIGHCSEHLLTYPLAIYIFSFVNCSYGLNMKCLPLAHVWDIWSLVPGVIFEGGKDFGRGGSIGGCRLVYILLKFSWYLVLCSLIPF